MGRLGGIELAVYDSRLYFFDVHILGLCKNMEDTIIKTDKKE